MRARLWGSEGTQSEGEKCPQASKRRGAPAPSGALGALVGLGESLLVGGKGMGWAPSEALCSFPSYLYPDGKNHNPDLAELCHMEPHQLIHVSEVKLRPGPPSPAPHTQTHTQSHLAREFPLPESGLGSQRPWGFLRVRWPRDLR